MSAYCNFICIFICLFIYQNFSSYLCSIVRHFNFNSRTSTSIEISRDLMISVSAWSVIVKREHVADVTVDWNSRLQGVIDFKILFSPDVMQWTKGD